MLLNVGTVIISNPHAVRVTAKVFMISRMPDVNPV